MNYRAGGIALQTVAEGSGEYCGILPWLLCTVVKGSMDVSRGLQSMARGAGRGTIAAEAAEMCWGSGLTICQVSSLPSAALGARRGLELHVLLSPLARWFSLS